MHNAIIENKTFYDKPIEATTTKWYNSFYKLF